MKKHFTLFIFSLILSTASFGQTKMIAHKSHSGSATTFKNSLVTDLFSNKSSNFGEAPVSIVKNAILDSVIFLTDSTTIMVTSNYCIHLGFSDTTLWKAGRDTVVNHPLFSSKNALDSVKHILDKDYYFKTPADSTVFVGYNNGGLQSQSQIQQQTQTQEQPQTKREIRKQRRKNRATSRKQIDDNNQSKNEKLMQKSSSTPLFYLVLVLALISFIFAFVQNRIRQKR